MYYVYCIQSKTTQRLYVGSTSNLQTRYRQHNAGMVRSTKAYLPWKLVYYEVHAQKYLALKAELFYKTGQGRRQIKKKLGLA